MLPFNIGVNINIGNFIPVKLLRKPYNRVGKQCCNQYPIYFFIQQVADNIIKCLVIVLIEKEFSDRYIIRFHLWSRLIDTIGNSFPIFSVRKRRSNCHKMILFFRCQRTRHQIRLIMNHFQNSLNFLPVLFRYPSTIVNHPVYRTDRDSRHLGDVYNTNIWEFFVHLLISILFFDDKCKMNYWIKQKCVRTHVLL